MKAGGISTLNHNEALQVRTALKAGRQDLNLNHNEALQVRSAIKAGRGIWGPPLLNHNEALQLATERPAVSMRRELADRPPARTDRLQLLVVRAGLRAGRRARGRVRR